MPSQSRSARQGRVAAPSVCFAAARILLAAAPTAPPCFRHWRRSSPLPPKGEPLAKPFTLRGLPKPPLGRGGGTASAVTERLSLARASRSGSVLVQPLSLTSFASSPSRGASGESVRPTRDEQSLIFSETGVLRCLDSRQLDKGYCPEAAALCSKARPFASYRASGVQ